MKNIKTQNKRAFTLTELLIVVIVIGVLSAVTLPKFNRVLENRKVTEAEEMMSAVRTEQERRCSLGQNYTTDFAKLTEVIASKDTKNYTYSLQAQGISAKRTSGEYTLKILSYEDGSYCCEGDGCDKLNKNYPKCNTLTFPDAACKGTEGGGAAGTDPGDLAECVDGEVSGLQPCNGCGSQTTKRCVNGKWMDVLGTCSKTMEECSPKQCTGEAPAAAVKQCECGSVSASYYCDETTGYEWKQKEFPECPVKPDSISETCSDGTTIRTKQYTCVNGTWTAGDWDRECPEGGDCSNSYYKVTHKAECCPGTPETDTVCWKQIYAWGPLKSISVDTTVTYNAYYVQGSGSERCSSIFALVYKTIYPDAVNSSASMLACPGNDERSVKGQSCYLRDIGTGPQPTFCFYSLGTGYETASGVSFRGCEIVSQWNGDLCKCSIAAWPGHECIVERVEQNGW